MPTVISILPKIITACLKIGYREMKKDYHFFKVFKDFDLEYPKDEFLSVYFHTCFILAAKGKNPELIKLFLLKDSQEAFKAEKKQNQENAFLRELNANLHTNPSIRELKNQNWNKVPDSEIDDFFEEYEYLTREVATPVQDKLIGNQEKMLDRVESGLDLLQDFKNSLEVLTAKSGREDVLHKEYSRQIRAIVKLIEKGLVNESLGQLLELKKEIWDTANNETRFRILTNIGVCYFKQLDQESAFPYLKEAYHFNPDSEIALNNIINAYISIDDKEEAKYYVKVFLDKKPKSVMAYASLIRLQEDRQSLNQVLSNMPSELKENAEILLALGLSERRLKNYNQAIEFIKDSIDRSSKSELLEEYLLSTILEKYGADFKVLNLRIINQTIREELGFAFKLIEKLIAKYEGSDLNRVKSQLYMNKSLILHLFDKQVESILAIDTAIDLERNDIFLLKQKGLILANSGESSQAIEVFEQIKDFSEVPDVASLLALLYAKAGQSDKGIKLLENFLQSDCTEDDKNYARGILLKLYIENEIIDGVQLLKEKAFLTESIFDLVQQARIHRYLGSPEEAGRILNMAKDSIIDLTPTREKFLLAEEFLDFGHKREAIAVYNLVIDRGVNSELNLRLVRLYYDIGEKGECIKLLREIREKNGLIKDFARYEISIYEEYRDYESAQRLAREYLSKYPDDLSLKIALAGFNWRLENFQELDQFLNENINLTKLDQAQIENYLSLLMSRNFRYKVFDIAYEYRRLKGNSDAHILFVRIMLQFPLTEEEASMPSKISINSVIEFEDPSGKIFYLTIEEKESNKLFENEINTSNEKYKILKGRKVGEVVQFPSSTTKWTIKSITNKYVHALRESQLKCNTLYSEKSPFMEFHGIDEFKEFLKEREKDGNEWLEKYKLASELYRERRIPLVSIAENFGKNVIEVWEEFRNTRSKGIQASSGRPNELEEAAELLKSKVSICSDILGLLTLFELEIEDIVIERFGKILISSSTYDLILTYSQEIRLFVSPKKSNSKSKFQLFHEFVNRVTERRVPKSIYDDVKVRDLNKIKVLLNDSSFDTYLLAKETNSLLYSDDVAFRDLANSEFSIKGVWSQALLRSLLDSGLVNNHRYQEGVLVLTQLNYFHTAIDKETLLLALKKAKYQFDDPFRNCLNYLSGKISSTESSIVVGFQFLYQLWSQIEVNQQYAENVTNRVITTLCTNRIIIESLEQLKTMVANQTIGIKNQANLKTCLSIWFEIEKWENTNGIVKLPFRPVSLESFQNRINPNG